MTLDRKDIEAIAERAAHRVVKLLERPSPGAGQLLDPKGLAQELNVSVDQCCGSRGGQPPRLPHRRSEWPPARSRGHVAP